MMMLIMMILMVMMMIVVWASIHLPYLENKFHLENSEMIFRASAYVSTEITYHTAVKRHLNIRPNCAATGKKK